LRNKSPLAILQADTPATIKQFKEVFYKEKLKLSAGRQISQKLNNLEINYGFVYLSLRSRKRRLL